MLTSEFPERFVDVVVLIVVFVLVFRRTQRWLNHLFAFWSFPSWGPPFSWEDLIPHTVDRTLFHFLIPLGSIKIVYFLPKNTIAINLSCVNRKKLPFGPRLIGNRLLHDPTTFLVSSLALKSTSRSISKSKMFSKLLLSDLLSFVRAGHFGMAKHRYHLNISIFVWVVASSIRYIRRYVRLFNLH